MQKVNFTTSFGDQVSFDENGDASPIYDIMNWLQLPDGRAKLQNVGKVKRSAYKGEELIINGDKIFWKFETKKVRTTIGLLLQYYFAILFTFRSI